jgi:phosphopantothenoylcysteine decarboxylase/phosphopantothenate--cysteine ligase
VRVGLLGEQTEGHVDHVTLTHQADLLVIAPATANTIAQLAGGNASDWITVVALGAQCPVLVAPAMEASMYKNPLTQRNLATLAGLSWHIMAPREGRLASGLMGQGRLPEPEEIVAEALDLLNRRTAKDLVGLHILVTAGTTREALDPVRYLGNRSTGKMGYALAAAAVRRGAQVTLVSGPTALTPPAGVALLQVESTLEMLAACQQAFPTAQIMVGAAAPADYRPAVYHEQKIKKSGDEITIALVKNPDILAELGKVKRPGQITVSFAAETEAVVENARKKLSSKNADLVVANDVTANGAGFGTETNQVTFVEANQAEALPLLSKSAVADRILDKAVSLLGR